MIGEGVIDDCAVGRVCEGGGYGGGWGGMKVWGAIVVSNVTSFLYILVLITIFFSLQSNIHFFYILIISFFSQSLSIFTCYPILPYYCVQSMQ